MWAAIRWVKGRKQKGPYVRRELPVEPEGLPPGVVAARAELRNGLCRGCAVVPRGTGVPADHFALPSSSSSSAAVVTSSVRAPETPGARSAAPGTPGLRMLETTTEAGESRIRTRPMGPWIANPEQERLARGSARLAVDIAGSSDRTNQAVSNFKDLIYAPSTSASKEALFGLWSRICKRRGVEPLPLTPEMIVCNSAILREAGYKSLMAYVHEARDRHSRAGFPWTAQHQSALCDAKRASKRAQGEAKRAEEIREEWWAWLINAYGLYPFQEGANEDAPKDAVDMMIIGHHFLLREVELSSIFLDHWCIRIDIHAQTVGLFLPVSKTDPGGQGVLRTLGCICKATRDVLCPYHAMNRVIGLQLRRTRFENLDDVPLAWLPLFGQKGDFNAPVSKVAFVRELQRLAYLILVGYPQRLSMVPDEVTGHSLRRSGIKALARKGVSFTAVQWLARHSSSVTMLYMEEAYEESPERQRTMLDARSIGEMLTELVGKQETMENAMNRVEADLRGRLEMLNSNQHILHDRQLLRFEMRRAMIPQGVINLDRQCLHVVKVSTCFDVDPTRWTTKCGWSWLRASSSAQPIFDDVEFEMCEAQQCNKCFNLQ